MHDFFTGIKKIILKSHPVTSKQPHKIVQIYMHHPVGQNLQLLAFIINFWRIFAFWHVDQSDFSIPKNNNKWQMLFLSNSCHSPRRRQRRNTLTNLKKTNNFWKCVGNTLCLKGNSLIFFNNLFIVKFLFSLISVSLNYT